MISHYVQCTDQVTINGLFLETMQWHIWSGPAQKLSSVLLWLHIITWAKVKQRWAVPALRSGILLARPWWSEVSVTGGVPAAANNKHRGGKWDGDGKNVFSVLIKASLPGWCVELDHRGRNSVQSINLGGFLTSSKVTRNDIIKNTVKYRAAKKNTKK